MSILFRKKYQKPAAIALDIGTEFVKALLFEVDDEHGTVLAHSKERQRLTDMQGGNVTDISGVIHTSAKALKTLFDKAGRSADQVIVGIAGELVKGTTTSTIYNRKRPNDPITEHELREIIAEAQKDILPRTKKELAIETGYQEIDIRLVNSAVVGVKIDGYTVVNPIGFQGRLVEVNIYTSYAPAVHLGAIQTIIEGLGLDLISVATEPYAVARCFGSEETSDTSSIFIDVGGGTTDIAVVRSGGLEGTKMFALGGRIFTKRIANSLKITFTEAEKIKLAYSNEQLETKDVTRVTDFIASDVSVWMSGVELALEEFCQSERFNDNKLLPSKIYLCGGGSLLPDLKNELQKKAWTKNFPFAKQPEVHYIKPKQVANIIDKTESLNSAQDITPMALANLALDLVGNNNPVSSTVNKILKGLRT